MGNKIFPASLKPIVSRGYGQTRGGNIWRSQVQGGLPRQGRDVFYDAVPISVVLIVSSLGRQAFWKFISSISGGADSFQMTHDSGNGLEPHNVLITSDISDTTQDGINWVISFTATAERTSAQEEDELTEALPPLYGEYGDGLIEFLDWYAIYCTTPNFIFDYDGDEPAQAVGTTAYFDRRLYYINNNAVAFDDLVTFSRLSGATYIDKYGALKTAAVNEPRFEKGGILVEPHSTNLVPYSEPSSTVAGQTGVGRVIVSFVGGFYVYTVNDTSSSQWGEVRLSGFESGTHTASINKMDWYGYYQMRFIVIAVVAGVEIVLNQTYLTDNFKNKNRYSVTFDVPEGATQLRLRMAPIVAMGVNEWFKMGGLQVEALPFATSYIPTIGAAATRAADSASVLMQPHSSGTIFAEFMSDSVAIERIVYIADAITLKRLSTGAISVTAGAVTVTSAVAPSGSVKSAISYDGATLKLSVNGVVYSAASALPSAGTSLVLGASTFANVWQRSEAYDNARLIEVTQ